MYCVLRIIICLFMGAAGGANEWVGWGWGCISCLLTFELINYADTCSHMHGGRCFYTCAILCIWLELSSELFYMVCSLVSVFRSYRGLVHMI